MVIDYSKLSEVSNDTSVRVQDSKRPTTDCIFSADSASVNDNKCHFPIPDEVHGRNAIARVNQYSALPKWYTGKMDLKEFVKHVVDKVKKKYPSIEVSEKAYTPKSDQVKDSEDYEEYVKFFSEDHSKEEIKEKIKEYRKKFGDRTIVTPERKELVAFAEYQDGTPVYSYKQKAWETIEDCGVTSLSNTPLVPGKVKKVKDVSDRDYSEYVNELINQGYSEVEAAEMADEQFYSSDHCCDSKSGVAIYTPNFDRWLKGWNKDRPVYTSKKEEAKVYESEDEAQPDLKRLVGSVIRQVSEVKDSKVKDSYKAMFSDREEAEEFLEGARSNELVWVYNEWANENNKPQIQENDRPTLNSLFENSFDAIKAVVTGKYYLDDPHIVLINGKLYSVASNDGLKDDFFDKVKDGLIEYLIK